MYLYMQCRWIASSVLAITASSQRCKYCEQYSDTGNYSLFYFVIFLLKVAHVKLVTPTDKEAPPPLF